MNWKKTCRVCLQSGDVVSLFDWDDSNEQLCDKYAFCCGVEVPEADALPTLICLYCVDRLAVAYEFKKQCLSSNETLQECLDEFLKTTYPGSTNIKQEPITETITIKAENGDELEYQLPIENDSCIQYTITNTDHAAVITKAPRPKKTGRPRKYPNECGVIGKSPYVNKKSSLSQEDLKLIESKIAALTNESDFKSEIEEDNEDDSIVETISIQQENGHLVQYELPVKDDASTLWTRKTLKANNSAIVTKAPEPKGTGRPRKYPNQLGLITKSPYTKSNKKRVALSMQDVETINLELEKLTGQSEVENDVQSDEQYQEEEILIEDDEREEEEEVPRPRGRPRSQKRIDIDKTVTALLSATIEGFVPTPDRALERQAPKLKKKKKIKEKPKIKKKYFYDKTHKCETCGNAFPSNAKLQAHIRRHLGINPYSCSICNYTSPVHQNLKRHLLIHTNLKPYKCTVCPKAYKDGGDLKKHMRTHNGVRPFQCSICKKTFTYSSVLNNHMITHTREEKFECKKCHKKFVRASHMKYHNKVHHKSAPMPKYSKLKIHRIAGNKSNRALDKSGIITAEIVDGVVTVFHRNGGDEVGTEIEDNEVEEKTPRKRGRPRKYPIVKDSPPKTTKKRLENSRDSEQEYQTHEWKPKRIKKVEAKTSEDDSDTKKTRVLDVRPLQCSICKKTFSYSSVLSNHMFTHTREDKFECKECHVKKPDGDDSMMEVLEEVELEYIEESELEMDHEDNEDIKTDPNVTSGDVIEEYVIQIDADYVKE